MRGDRLKEIRERQDLSQRDLAARCEIGEKQIWRYENGESEPTAGMLIKICHELAVSSDYLLGLVDNAGDFFTGDPFDLFEQSVVSCLRRRTKLSMLEVIERLLVTVMLVEKLGGQLEDYWQPPHHPEDSQSGGTLSNP